MTTSTPHANGPVRVALVPRFGAEAVPQTSTRVFRTLAAFDTPPFGALEKGAAGNVLSVTTPRASQRQKENWSSWLLDFLYCIVSGVPPLEEQIMTQAAHPRDGATHGAMQAAQRKAPLFQQFLLARGEGSTQRKNIRGARHSNMGTPAR